MPNDAPAPVEVRTWLSGPVGESGGAIVVQVEHPSDWMVELRAPEVSGVVFAPAGEGRVETIGARVVDTRSWTFSAPPGAWEIPGFRATWSPSGASPGEVASSPLFVHVGGKADEAPAMVDIADPPRVRSVPWRPLDIAMAAVVAVGTALVVRRVRRKPASVAARVPPDVVAVMAWEATRADPTLDPHAKAVVLSRIFRDYVEAVLHFPATSWSTTETLDHLGSLPHLAEGNIPRARRLLRATDRVKYAEATPGADLFEDLDADLRAFIAATRPHVWEQP